jgi:predicted O-methyltransferase YrrM
MMKCETNVLQDPTEFARFLSLIREQEVKSYLEIGSKNGGSLWRVANTLPKGSRVVSVDLPHGDTSFKVTEPNLKICVDELARRGYDAHLFLSDSTKPETVDAVRALGPFDLVFIDANHTEPYVRKDWANYGPMGRMVAFHDIGWKAQLHKDRSKKMPIEVPIVWRELRREFPFVEISCCPADNGIGVLWRDQKR